MNKPGNLGGLYQDRHQTWGWAETTRKSAWWKIIFSVEVTYLENIV
jgi:hypothetical protein